MVGAEPSPSTLVVYAEDGKASLNEAGFKRMVVMFVLQVTSCAVVECAPCSSRLCVSPDVSSSVGCIVCVTCLLCPWLNGWFA